MDVVSACRSRGWQLVVASDAVMAVTVARRERPDVIVLKGKLPGGGGTTAIRRLCANVHTAAIPLIALTEDADSSEQKLHDAGARNCMTGPVAAEALCAEIEKCVGTPLTRTEAPSIEVRDTKRLAALDGTGLLDTAPDERFDVLTSMAAKLIGVPTALLSLVDRDRQFFKSHVGLGEPYAQTRETPLSHSFCQWVVSGKDALAVSDAREHPILQKNLAIRDLGVIAYAGAPVAEESGRLIGAFCAIDSKPHAWAKTDLETLRDLSTIATAQVAIASPDHRDRPLHMHGLVESIRAVTRILRRSGDRLDASDVGGLLDILHAHTEYLSSLVMIVAPLLGERTRPTDTAA